MDAMVERIERLERSVRRFRWAGGAIACLAVVGLVMGQKVDPKNNTKVLEVDKIIATVVDARMIQAQNYSLLEDDTIRGL